jgi:hypothetical protein
MLPGDNLLAVLQKLMEADLPVKLLNHYRGLPVSYDAQIIAIDQGALTLRVHRDQAVCIVLENRACLLEVLPVAGRRLPASFWAEVVSLDLAKKQVVLAEFSRAGRDVDRRRAVRLQPEELIGVDMEVGGIHFTGKLADISVTGLGIFSFGTYVFSEHLIARNAEITLECRLPVVDALLQVKGKAVHAASQRESFMQRVGIRIQADQEARQVLQQYIELRKEELLRELSFIYDSMLVLRDKS